MKKTTKKKTAKKGTGKPSKVYAKPGVYTLQAASTVLGLALSTLRSLIQTHSLESLCTYYHFGDDRSSLVIEAKNLDRIRKKCIERYERARALGLASASGGAGKSAARLAEVEVVVEASL